MPFKPGKPTTISIPLQPILKGHRIMVQVQSTLFPFFDRNPQHFVPNIFEATAEDFIRATHRVYISGDEESRIELSVLEEQPGLAARTK